MKRILASVLVVVMLILSLASCGYSIAKEDFSKYTTFTAEDKAAFEKALAALVIEDGEFTADEATRLNKLEDDLYANLAATVDKDDMKYEGTPAAHDVIHYSYYITAEFDGEVKIFNVSNMKTDSAAKVQLGKLDVTRKNDADEEVKTLDGKLIDKLTGVDLKDKTYKSTTTGAAKEGSVVYVTYTYSYSVTDDKGVTSDKTGTVTNARVEVLAAPADGAKAASLASYLCNKTVNTSLDAVKITEDGKGEVSYSGIKINWIAEGAEFCQVVDVTYEDEKKVNDINGKSYDLKDKELTYHVYPVGYLSVPEYNALTIINELIAENMSLGMLETIIFEKSYEDKTDAEKAEILKGYEVKEGDKTYTLEQIADEIAKLQKTYKDKLEAYEKAEKEVDAKEADRDSYKNAVDEAGDKATEEQKTKLSDAEKALETAKKSLETAKTAYESATADRDAKVTVLLSAPDMEKKITDGYRRATKEYLIDEYNSTIKMNLAKEIYYFIEKYVKVNSLPEKAVKESYDQIIENYQYTFYNEQFDSTNKITNYAKYEGSFQKFLIAKISSAKTYAEAEAAVKVQAESYVKPIVMLYAIAEAYGVLATEDEYKEYMENTDNNYSYNEYTYGANSVRYAYQFDKLMNHFLDSEEDEATGKVTYKNYGVGNYKFGTPASEATVTDK